MKIMRVESVIVRLVNMEPTKTERLEFELDAAIVMDEIDEPRPKRSNKGRVMTALKAMLHHPEE